MSCHECKCKVTYPYHEDEFYTDIGMQRCASCGYIFYDEMANEDEEDYLEPEYEKREALDTELTDLRAACEQKQEIINSFALVDKARRDQAEELRAENARLRELMELVVQEAKIVGMDYADKVCPISRCHIQAMRAVLGGE